MVAALYATIAVLAALYARRDTGRGQRVTIDLLHASLALLANQSTGFLASGDVPLALGNVHPSIEPFATYRAADGELMICAGNDAQFRRLGGVLGAPEDDARFATNEVRVANRDELRHGSSRSSQHGREPTGPTELAAAGVPAGPVQTIDEAFSLAETLGLDVVDETDGVRTVAFPAHLSETPGDGPPPAAGSRRARGGDQERMIVTSTPAFFSSVENGQPASARSSSVVRDVVGTADRHLRRDDLVALPFDLVHHDAAGELELHRAACPPRSARSRSTSSGTPRGRRRAAPRGSSCSAFAAMRVGSEIREVA